MNWIYTPESSHVYAFSYAARTKTLYVCFKAKKQPSKMYAYQAVPRYVYDWLKVAKEVGSVGKALHKYVFSSYNAVGESIDVLAQDVH